MKKTTLITMITILFLGVITAGYSKTPAQKSAINSAKEIQKIISKSITYPDFALKQGLKDNVTITFTVNAEGKIELKNINCKHDEIKEYVKEQLKNITIQDVIHPLNQQYRVNLKFGMS